MRDITFTLLQPPTRFSDFILIGFFFKYLERLAIQLFFGYIFHAGMNMAAITKAIPEMSLRTWLDDILINLLRMWEYNM